MNVQEKKKRVLPPVTLEESYQLCDTRVRPRLKPYRWLCGHLSDDRARSLTALLALADRSNSLCDMRIERAVRVQRLEDLREDFRNNFMEEESTDQFPALLDTMKRYSIPQQYLHDVVAPADMCIRIEQFQEFDQWTQMACRMGGGCLLSAIPILGLERAGYESAAVHCGQAFFLTSLLSRISRDPQNLQYFMPAQDARELGINLEQLGRGRPTESLTKWVEVQLKRIEPFHAAGAALISYLSQDAARVMKSVVALSWHRFKVMQKRPDAVAAGRVAISKSELLRFRFQHMMGLERCEIISKHSNPKDH